MSELGFWPNECEVDGEVIGGDFGDGDCMFFHRTAHRLFHQQLTLFIGKIKPLSSTSGLVQFINKMGDYH